MVREGGELGASAVVGRARLGEEPLVDRHGRLRSRLARPQGGADGVAAGAGGAEVLDVDQERDELAERHLAAAVRRHELRQAIGDDEAVEGGLRDAEHARRDGASNAPADGALEVAAHVGDRGRRTVALGASEGRDVPDELLGLTGAAIAAPS